MQKGKFRLPVSNVDLPTSLLSLLCSQSQNAWSSDSLGTFTRFRQHLDGLPGVTISCAANGSRSIPKVRILKNRSGFESLRLHLQGLEERSTCCIRVPWSMEVLLCVVTIFLKSLWAVIRANATTKYLSGHYFNTIPVIPYMATRSANTVSPKRGVTTYLLHLCNLARLQCSQCHASWPCRDVDVYHLSTDYPYENNF